MKKPETFYMVVYDGRTDGVFDLDMEKPTVCKTEEEAIEEATSNVEEYGLKSWIIKCEAVVHVTLKRSIKRYK